MNIYGVDAGEVQIHCCIDHESMACYEETDHIIEIIAARSRGHARSRVAHEWNLEFTAPMTIRLLKKDVPITCTGTIFDCHDYITDELGAELWWLLGKAFYPESTPGDLETHKRLMSGDLTVKEWEAYSSNE